MPKRKKHPRLPNGFGSIRFVGKGRANPYAVHPPVTDFDDSGKYIRPKAICYVDDWYVGFGVLNAWHAGTYQPGDEERFKQYRACSAADLDAFCSRLLTDFSAHAHTEAVQAKGEKTFRDVYEDFFEWKYGENARRKLSEQSKSSTQAAFKNCAALHDQPFRSLSLDDLQNCINSCHLKRASLELIQSLFRQMYRYAIPRELCDKDLGQYVVIPDAEDDEHGVPFSDDELKVLWASQSDPDVEMILIMCYSGFRISAYQNIKIDMQDWFFQGGVKTATGKNRIVPIHSAIRCLVKTRMSRDGCLLNTSACTSRRKMYDALDRLGIKRHTPHDCRHTFSRLCEKYHVNDADRRRMLGHSFGSDITNGIYGHRTLEELRNEIEKIKI